MELPTLFLKINPSGQVAIENYCFRRSTRLDVRRYKTRQGFVKSARATKGKAMELEAFFDSLCRVGPSAYTTLSLINEQEIGHSVPVTFFQRGSTIHVEITEIRGTNWPNLSGFYQPQSLLSAVKSLLKRCNLYRRMQRKSPLHFRVAPPLRYKWAQYLVAGNEYSNRWVEQYSDRPTINCRVAALTYIWLRTRKSSTRLAAVAALKRFASH